VFLLKTPPYTEFYLIYEQEKLRNTQAENFCRNPFHPLSSTMHVNINTSPELLPIKKYSLTYLRFSIFLFNFFEASEGSCSGSDESDRNAKRSDRHNRFYLNISKNEQTTEVSDVTLAWRRKCKIFNSDVLQVTFFSDFVCPL
jgi:hypothetical protein